MGHDAKTYIWISRCVGHNTFWKGKRQAQKTQICTKSVSPPEPELTPSRFIHQCLEENLRKRMTPISMFYVERCRRCEPRKKPTKIVTFDPTSWRHAWPESLEKWLLGPHSRSLTIIISQNFDPGGSIFLVYLYLKLFQTKPDSFLKGTLLENK